VSSGSSFAVLDELEAMTERQREDLHAHMPRFVAAPPEGVTPLFVVKESKKPVCRDVVARRVSPRPDVELTGKVRALWDEGVEESCDLARRFEALAPYWAGRDDVDADPFAVEKEDLMVAVAMRMTRGNAAKAITDAHRAVDLLPRCTQALAAGEFPAEWFKTLLRRTMDFTPADMVLVDVTVASWCLAIMPSVFTKYLDLLVTRIQQRHPQRPRRSLRVASSDGRRPWDTRWDGVPADHRSRPGDQGPRRPVRSGGAGDPERPAPRPSSRAPRSPLDPDGQVETYGMPLSLNLIRYHLAHAAQIDTGGITVPEARFRLNVLVPFLTLAGGDDAPGVLEDGTPIQPRWPARSQGRVTSGSASSPTPSTGEFLPRPAEKYRPTGAMLEHLRLRGQSCGVPGCERSASIASEADHIEEYDHVGPGGGWSDGGGEPAFPVLVPPRHEDRRHPRPHPHQPRHLTHGARRNGVGDRGTRPRVP
jgi:hypothetical protein